MKRSVIDRLFSKQKPAARLSESVTMRDMAEEHEQNIADVPAKIKSGIVIELGNEMNEAPKLLP